MGLLDRLKKAIKPGYLEPGLVDVDLDAVRRNVLVSAGRDVPIVTPKSAPGAEKNLPELADQDLIRKEIRQSRREGASPALKTPAPEKPEKKKKKKRDKKKTGESQEDLPTELPVAPPSRTAASGLLARASAESTSEAFSSPAPTETDNLADSLATTPGAPVAQPEKLRQYETVDAIQPGSEDKPASGRGRRKSERGDKSRKGLKLSFRAHDIIPRNSPYNQYFRSLLNAERFLAEKEYNMAIDVYQRILNKIQNRGIQEKIRRNIEDIEEYLENLEEEETPPRVNVQFDPSQFQPQKSEKNLQDPEGGESVLSSTFGSPMGKWPGSPPRKPEEHRPDRIAQTIKEGLFEIQKAMFEGKKFEIVAQGGIEIKGADGGAGSTLQMEKISETAEIGKIAESANFSPEALSGIGGAAGTGTETGAGAGTGTGAGKETEAGAGGGASSKTAEKTGSTDHSQSSGTESGSQTGSEPGGEESSQGGINESPPEIGAPGTPEVTGTTPGAGAPEAIPEDLVEPEPIEEPKKEKPEIQEIRGVLELKTPEQEDTPFLTLTYDFTKIPHRFALSRNHTILEYAYYKYKSMLVKAHRFIKRKQITKALNYYRVIREQQIPEEFRAMIDRNIQDITEYLQKYLMTRQEN